MRHLALLLVCPLALASAPGGPAPSGDGPRLVVLITVDQLVPEQLERLAPQLDGGLGRLVREGLRFENARLDYAVTATGPGHATFATGCLPRAHGIVGNDVFDRATRETRYCMASTSARAVTDAGVVEGRGYSGRSAENVRVATLGERLAALDPRVRVVSIAGKDRSALGMAGHRADAVLWWDRVGGGFMSSDAYCAALPEWVTEFNAGWARIASGWTWAPVFDLQHPPAGTRPDERDGETPRGEFGVTFPYVLPAFEVDELDPGQRAALAGNVFGCPLLDRFTVDLAREAVRELELGADDVLDVLAVGLSSCDVTGHGFGPFSCEVTDVVLRVDDALGELFDDLDARVGRGRWIAALTADHGVLPLPESLVAEGIPARRVTGAESAALRRGVVERLKRDFGGDCGLKYELFSFSIDEDAVRAAGHAPADVRAAIADEAAQVDWVQAAYTLEELRGVAPSEDPFLALFRNSACEGLTPDVMLLQAARHLVALGKGTSHGSAHDYDRRIPLVFHGPGFAAGSRAYACGSQDALPTLFAALGLPAPEGVDGRNLVER
jgi:hypothetical protein